MSQMFSGKIAVVTGAGGTLCSEIAIQLALEGAKVFLVGRTTEKLVKTADKIKELGGVEPVLFPCDVTDRESVLALAKATEQAGGCDFLINGAGGNNVKAMPTITKFDPRELTGELPEGASQMAVIPREDKRDLIAVSCTDSDFVVLYDDELGVTTAAIIVDSPYGIAWSAMDEGGGGARLFVASFAGQSVEIIDVPDLNAPQIWKKRRSLKGPSQE